MNLLSAQTLAKLVVAVLLAVFGGTGLALYVDDGDPATPPVKIIDFRAAQTQSEEITLPATRSTPERTLAVDADNQLERTEQRAAATEQAPTLHEDLVDETPPGVSRETLAAGRERTAELADERLAAPVEPAGAQAYSCPARPVVNQSGLSGRRVGVAIHFTVSPPGSLDNIRRLFNTSSFGASSNYGFELFNLRCQQWVPESRKAWAQGAANSAYVSIEIISNNRSRGSWLGTPAFKRGILAALVRDIARRHGAPLKLVDPRGCVFPPGITDHDRLECGNTHWDVGPNFPWDVFMRQVRAGVSSPTAGLSPVSRKLARKRCYHRTKHVRAPAGSSAQRRHLAWARYWKARIGDRRAKLRQLGLSKKGRRARHRRLGGYAIGKAC